MFGSKKKRLITHVTTAMHPFIINTQREVGIPKLFWDDDYVLGFVGFCIAFHMNKTSRINSTPTEKGAALIEIMTNLSHMNGLPLARKYNKLTAEKSNQDFEAGADNAATWIFYLYNALKDEQSNEYVLKASNNGFIKDREIIGINLFDQLFIQPLKNRFKD